MSNDPLALSGIAAGLPQEAEYDAVYAAVTATERGRWFLSQYSDRNRYADTESLVAAIARIEAAVCGDAAPQSGAVSGNDLAEIAAAIERIGAAVGAERTRAPDIAAAAERILDITIELRERAVKTALCDAIDAAAREIYEASATGKTNDASGSRDVTQMLRELAGRVDGFIKLSRGGGASSAAAVDEVLEQSPESEGLRPAALIEPAPTEAGPVTVSEREGVSEPESVKIFLAPSGPFELELQDDKKFAEAAAALTASFAALGADSQAAIQELPQNEVGNEAATPVVAQEESAGRDEPAVAAPEERLPSSSYIQPPDFMFDPPKQTTNADEDELFAESNQAHPLLPGPQLLPNPEDDPADLFEPLAQAAPAPVHAQAETPPPESSPPQLRLAAGTAMRPAQRPNNPLTALRALSEDELIALFG
jgi:hypothetical protein